ncbi:hypothetical protein ACIP2X_03220 [Streptomyces sp. NPDC089424]|uniref:hypothetical protein n=1 Tax=Streptomyces sp. NPDC089424 TaxID=3365917 RepID=UPI003804DBF8
MSAPGPAANSIEAATALLQSELVQLEERQEGLYLQQQSVQAELAVVSGHIESLRGALAALRALPPTVPPAADGAPVAGAPVDGATAERAPTGGDGAVTAARLAPELLGRGFTEQVIAVLSGDPGAALRARDVAEALGRAGSAGSINAVRSTLDRLVATSRAYRAGRGLYQASPPGRR